MNGSVVSLSDDKKIKLVEWKKIFCQYSLFIILLIIGTFTYIYCFCMAR